MPAPHPAQSARRADSRGGLRAAARQVPGDPVQHRQPSGTALTAAHGLGRRGVHTQAHVMLTFWGC